MRRYLATALLAAVLGRGCNAVPASLSAPPITEMCVVDIANVDGHDIWAASDIHGGYDRFVTLLVNNKLIAASPVLPEEVRWTAGSSYLVVTGDLIDKGSQGLATIKLLQRLSALAVADNGQVIVTLGNHEAEFLNDPYNSKAAASNGFDGELDAQQLSALAVARGDVAPGQWLRTRPFATRIGDWFFSHAGDSQGDTVEQLDARLSRARLQPAPYGSDDIVGASSILESRNWYSKSSTVDRNLAALRVSHIVFGHDPNALGQRGRIAMQQNGSLFRIDCGMTPDVDDSRGCLLHVSGNVSADACDSEGICTRLWTTQ
jgi:hypothetical protein